MAEFGSDEHVKSLSRRKLENLFRYVFNSRNDLNTIIKQQSQEIFDLRRKVANQAKQLKEVQAALERRNQGEMKARWQRTLDAAKAENERLRSFAQRLYAYAMDEYPDGTELNFADEARELGVDGKKTNETVPRCISEIREETDQDA